MQTTEAAAAIVENKIPILGLALIAALILGKFSKKLNVPKVTAFIFTGILLGPTGLNLMNSHIAHSFHFLSDIAMGLILFNIGGDFDRDLLQKIGWKNFKEVGLAGLFNLLIVFTLTFLAYSQITGDYKLAVIVAAFLSFVALECAPPTTLLVMKEYNANGPLQRSILTYLALATVVALVGTQIIEVILKILNIWPAKEGVTPLMQLGLLVWSLVGSVVLGFILGFFLSYWEQKEKKSSEFLMLVGSTILFGQTLSHFLKTDPLIISTVIGFTVVNSTTSGKEIHKGINEMGLSIYAIFFILAGAHINLREFTPAVLMMAIVYVLSRTFAFYFGSILTGKMIDSFAPKSKYFGLSTLSHAGIALAIVSKIMPIDTPSSNLLVTIIMSSIFVFEILGPLCLKYSLFQSGEVKGAKGDEKNYMKKTSVSVGQLMDNLQENLNIKKEVNEDLKREIKHFIKTDIISVKEKTSILNVQKFVYQHSFPYYPVVDEKSKFLGVIDLTQLMELSQEDENSFITATAITITFPTIHSSSSLEEVVQFFEGHQYHTIPVVHQTSGELLGSINRKDIMQAISDQKTQTIVE
ncbi:putative Na(+)/H(+) antiporter [Halobacteriovorax marinus SJ]|uniref:Na(+)/H(+) antiporter n=1 Tax=Halobacteriovorax marinus (strain ATCC BAA-682 / DSM 15412 / SJ) TaxID=862908 RepID=E1WZR9_HALMS|nr:cation:proton antiporter [Halobacteriovorax marinus]CBW26255.1 putative Na(+)/H(+) antiporter [Halobacteriovorax marinus SJ]